MPSHSNIQATFDEFKRRLTDSWLPAYCHDHSRKYDEAGFRIGSIDIADVDGADCVAAIDLGVVFDVGGGRYRASMSTATEPLFWEGSRNEDPRPITLWREPVITFAALGRLARDFGWPKHLLGTQPQGWAFDLAAHSPNDPKGYRILGEVKKSASEFRKLAAELQQLASGESAGAVSENTQRKWLAIVDLKPQIVWLIGPARLELVLEVRRGPGKDTSLQESNSSLLRFDAA
jgi:hypothetical protein